MNSDIPNHLIWPRAAADAAVDHDELLGQLLQEMIAGIRRYLATPLQEMIDSVGISSAALRNLSNAAGNGEFGHLPDWGLVEFGLDRLVDRALHDGPWSVEAEEAAMGGCSCGTGLQPCGCGENDSTANAGQPSYGRSLNPLALWLDDFFTVMREVHPRAIEIVQLRLDGHECRDIAERTGLGLRLVQRMIHDLRAAWTDAGERGES